jgi:hypothetical protein
MPGPGKPFKKGQSGNPAGRKKGTPNKATIAVKEAIERAFEGLGGVPSLIEWAKGNPDLFYGSVWPKILPRDFNISVDVTLRKQIVEQTTTLWLTREHVAEMEHVEERAASGD